MMKNVLKNGLVIESKNLLIHDLIVKSMIELQLNQ